MNPRLIILEGPDNCGKTTLAKILAAALGAVYWKMTAGQGLTLHSAMELYQRNALDNAAVNIEHGQSVVFDRHWPSDQVYGAVLRDGPSCDRHTMFNWCDQLGAIYIYCTRDNVVAEHEKAQDPDHPYPADQFQSIVDGYEKFFERLRTRTTVFRYHLDSALADDTLIPELIENIKQVP
jgi:thymidylate kinase